MSSRGLKRSKQCWLGKLGSFSTTQSITSYSSSGLSLSWGESYWLRPQARLMITLHPALSVQPSPHFLFALPASLHYLPPMLRTAYSLVSPLRTYRVSHCIACQFNPSTGKGWCLSWAPPRPPISQPKAQFFPLSFTLRSHYDLLRSHYDFLASWVRDIATPGIPTLLAGSVVGILVYGITVKGTHVQQAGQQRPSWFLGPPPRSSRVSRLGRGPRGHDRILHAWRSRMRTSVLQGCRHAGLQFQPLCHKCAHSAALGA